VTFQSPILCAVVAVAIQMLSLDPAVGPEITQSQNVTQQERTQYERVLAYLRKADLLPFVQGAVASHGRGASFHVTFTFVSDDKSKADILAILRNTKIFNIGRFGSAHATEVGATVRADAYDFRSRNGVLGPQSLEVMINHTNFLGYADLDRYDMYGGVGGACAHVLLEFLPDKIRTLFQSQ
jgi:hypothetical protein